MTLSPVLSTTPLGTEIEDIVSGLRGILSQKIEDFAGFHAKLEPREKLVGIGPIILPIARLVIIGEGINADKQIADDELDEAMESLREHKAAPYPRTFRPGIDRHVLPSPFWHEVSHGGPLGGPEYYHIRCPSCEVINTVQEAQAVEHPEGHTCSTCGYTAKYPVMSNMANAGKRQPDSTSFMPHKKV